MKNKILLTVFSSFLLLTSNAQTWTQKSDIPGSARRNTVGFTINGKGYVCLGGVGSSLSSTHFTDLYEYDPTSDTWTSKANFPAVARRNGIAFVIDSFAIVGMGWNNANTFYDLHRYNVNTNTWDTIATYAGDGGRGAYAAAYGSKAYVGGGRIGTSNFKNDFWVYDAQNNNWTQKANLPFSGRGHGVSFSTSSNIYVGLGHNSIAYKDFWAYDPTSDSWTQKANFPGQARLDPVYFELGGKFIVGGGTGTSSNTGYDDYYEYDPVVDTWTSLGSFSLVDISRGAYFSINNKGYIATGSISGNNIKNVFEYSPITTSISNNVLNNETLKVAPNPSNGIFRIELKTKEYEKIIIRNIQGQIIKEINLTNEDSKVILDISNEATGVYFVNVIGEGNQENIKIIKQ